LVVELADAHAAALDVTGAFVAAVGDDQWTQPTPCAAWNVRELVNHIVTGNWWARELVSGRTIDEVGDRYEGDVLGDDPVAHYDESALAASSAFLAPGAMEVPCAVSYGPVPGRVYCGHRLVDVLIHGWDVAIATGQDATLPSDLIAACAAVVAPEHEMLVASGMFGSDVPVDDDADPQTRLLASLGRHP
jgi:uncharacterized protein (TIGR03086 family)